MDYQSVFKRYEMKYLLTPAQKARTLIAMAPYMALDQYGKTTLRNIYYDTDTYRLARHSIEHPVYKEKLRLRSYGQAAPDAPVFVEVKKKYRSVVYKRRLSLPEAGAVAWLAGRSPAPEDGQIAREIEYFRDYYQSLGPAVFLSYEREAYYSLDGAAFRVTFDENILARQDRLSLEEDVGGDALLPPGRVLMEIKTAGGMPLWMARFLSEQRIFKASFSKYGAAYQALIFPTKERSLCYA